jgi:asparagine synthase (glutamine-hydrolysing)
MCGIFALLNYDQKYNQDFIQTQFEKGKGRGPENSIIQKVGNKILFGFHRLAINGLNSESNQPLIKGDLTLICNGEIYNYKELYALMSSGNSSVLPKTQSDCEVILWLYEKYGIEQTLQMLDGVFAFALLDQRIENGEPTLYLARDPYGVRPLYTMYHALPAPHPYMSSNETTIGFASELKMLSKFGTDRNQVDYAHFTPGTYSKYVFSDKVCSEWAPIHINKVYHRTAFPGTLDTDLDKNHSRLELVYRSSQGSPTLLLARTPESLETSIVNGIQKYLVRAVEKRCSTTERPIACLLSGGLDSSLIAALVNDYHKHHGLPQLETYSIGLANSTDLEYARIVAYHLGTNHHEVILTEQEFCEAIPEVIGAIESYDTTTVRASIGNYLLGKYIAANSDAKVIFNGDGSDELLGGYLYMKMAPDGIEFDRECRRLLKDIHAFDVLRSDKSISSHGLEPRTPFLDREWTQYYLSISPSIRFAPEEIEKYLLRFAFSRRLYQTRGGYALLPEEVLMRKKEAFSDGVSGHERSLYQVLQEYCGSKFTLDSKTKTYEDLCKKHPLMTNVRTNYPKTAEQFYYRLIFETCYPGQGKVVPYFWMPKYVDATDASARTLDIYNADES